MRQWGSSLNHNGMSFFLAQIPAGTELYHGTGVNVTVKGVEWLAFEPEHAMNFARKFNMKPRPPPKDREPPPDEHDRDQSDRVVRSGDLDSADQTALRLQHLLGRTDCNHAQDDKDKRPPHRRPGDDFEVVPGWLHTYTMKYDLRVIYIDGEAAAKSQKGTLDSQDYILAPADDRDGHDEPGRGPGDEYGRAKQMCSMAANEWGGRIDGFIRMEHGFELILCDFEKSADIVRMARVSNGDGLDGDDGGMSLFSFLHAIGARYHGIGGERVKLDYDDFVTAFTADIDLFHDDSLDLPRLKNITKPQRESFITALTKVVLAQKPISNPTNWQSIADMIIARYSDPLHSLAFRNISKTHLDYSLTLLLRPFIDYDARNRSLEVYRCATHFLPPPTSSPSLARHVSLSVSTRICSALFSAFDDSDTATSQIRIQHLITWLAWTSWKECRPGCTYDEFCLTAIWPLGDKRSHETPYCVTASGLEGVIGQPGRPGSYWDGLRRRH